MNKSYLLGVYKKEGPLFIKGKGSFLWDEEGNKYLDLFPGWGVSILGHTHSRIVKVISEQAKKLIHLPNNLKHRYQELLAGELVKRSYKAKVFFANSGTEAVETAIKFSRLYGKGERFEIITMKNSFHGRTFASLSATGQKKYKAPFRPLLPKFREAKFNDFESLKKNFNKKTVGVIIELIQGEGGINVAESDYIKDLYNFCKENDLLLIIDEIQTGLGRTGKWFCYQRYGIKPDIILLSKGLGAGFPISAVLIREDIAGIMKPGLHASTFGGNPLATRIALEVLKVIEEEKILLNVKKMSEYLFGRLFGFKEKFKAIKKIEGMGLMVGVKLKKESYPFFLSALRKRLIINATHKNVLRIMPALNVKKEEIDLGLKILEEVFKELC
ncbi:MAG: aspartate aminotransferase family protein [Candidatus Omnitrophota bacterium]|nr:MAG: aspartate aminotransferase family protein [Candidatus Omnitrophota bacterium]